MRTAPLRRVLASLAGLGVVASGLALAALPSANAAISTAPGPIYPYAYSSQSVNVTPGTVTIPAGLTYRIALVVNISAESDLTPVSGETVFGIAGFTPTVPAGLTVVYPTSYSWTASGMNGCFVPRAETATLTLPASSCATYVNGNWGMTVKNPTSSPIVWDLPSETAKLSVNGTAIEQTRIDFVDNYIVALTASRQFSQVDMFKGAPLQGDEGNISMNFFNPCFDATNGDVLSIVYVATLDNVAISTASGAGTNIRWTVGSSSSDTPPPTYTYQEQTPFFISAQLNNISQADAGKLLRISIDFKKNGKSVSGECGYGGGGPSDTGYPTLSALSTAAQAQAKAMLGALSAAYTLPSGTISSDNSGFVPDIGGGMFYWGASGATVKIVNLGATAPKPIASATSKMLTLTLPAGHRFYGLAWYGSGRDKWAALSGGTLGYKLWLGNLANGQGRSEKTLEVDELSTVCSLPSFASASLVSAPTTFPTIRVGCNPYSNGQFSTSQTVIAKANVGAGAAVTLTKLATQGDITEEKKCSFGSFGVNTKASGTDAALIVYGSIAPTPAAGGGQGSPSPMCSVAGITGRKVTTISQAGVATTTNLTQSPWGAVDPTSIAWATGKAANTWIGIARIGADSYPVTVSATRAVVKKASKISYLAATNFAAAGVMGTFEELRPIAEVSATKWVVSRIQRAMSMSGSSSVVANATLDPATGKVTSGQALKVTGLSSSYSGRLILNFNTRFVASKWYTNFYVVSAAGKFKVATWWASNI